MSRASEPTHPIPRPRLGCAAVERGFPWTETPSHFKGDRLHFLAEFEDFRRSRVREFLGGTASRIFFFRLDIPPYVPEKAQPLSHFPWRSPVGARREEACAGWGGRPPGRISPRGVTSSVRSL